jgi:hypothetical protein
MADNWWWLAFGAAAILVSSLASGWIAKGLHWSPPRCYQTARWGALGTWVVGLIYFGWTRSNWWWLVTNFAPLLAGPLARKIAFPEIGFSCGPNEPLVPRGDPAIEETTLLAFVKPTRRRLYRELVRDRNGRGSIARRLQTGDDIDDRYAVRVPEAGGDWKAVAAMLTERGAPPTCYVISRNERLNGTYVPLNDAVASACSGGGVTLVSCIPGKLGFFGGMYADESRLLVRE